MSTSQEFIHSTHDFDGLSVDVVEYQGNLWFSGSTIAEALGIQPKRGSFSRSLRRLSEFDLIKVTDTPFRFRDGRRNRGYLVSPRGAHRLTEGAHSDAYNVIKACDLYAWMEKTFFTADAGADHWSPKEPAKVTLEPFFREVTKASPKASNQELDDRGYRAELEWKRSLPPRPLADDEVEFTMRGPFKLTFASQKRFPVMDGEVVDEGDPWVSGLAA